MKLFLPLSVKLKIILKNQKGQNVNFSFKDKAWPYSTFGSHNIKKDSAQVFIINVNSKMKG